MQQWHVLADALLSLQQELQQLGLWSELPPSPAALSSQEPFCVDTLAFEEWLQWVFIPRMGQIVELAGVLPSSCNIQPMGEEAFAHLGRRGAVLLELLGHIDRTVQRGM